jgi:geranylgeranyl reductase family protein
VTESAAWDVAVVGAGPAGLAAAHTAAAAGARTIVLERAEHPRYKTCGGGLIGASLAEVADRITLPADDSVHSVVVTKNGDRRFVRRSRAGSLVTMVRREAFDDALRLFAVAAGAVIQQRAPVRAVSSDGGFARAALADGTTVAARVLVGADGSSGVTGRHVGVQFRQVDLGLELELPVPGHVQREWAGKLLIDWGPIPGSYGWVFPKGDLLTVGVIAPRGNGEETKRYLRRFVDHLGFAGYEPVHDSGHLTRCRTDDSPLRRGPVLVAGDAAGLLEPLTREGISFALRSGRLAGAAAATAALDPDRLDDHLDGYARGVADVLVPEMRAGARLLTAFSRHPGVFHAALATPMGWRAFERVCRGELSLAAAADNRLVRALLAVLARR